MSLKRNWASEILANWLEVKFKLIIFSLALLVNRTQMFLWQRQDKEYQTLVIKMRSSFRFTQLFHFCPCYEGNAPNFGQVRSNVNHTSSILWHVAGPPSPLPSLQPLTVWFQEMKTHVIGTCGPLNEVRRVRCIKLMRAHGILTAVGPTCMCCRSVRDDLAFGSRDLMFSNGI